MAATVVSELKGINAMTTLKIAEEEILTFDVSDEALEIAGMVTGTTNFTFGVCTFEQPGCPPSIDPEPLR
jgi:hypothetical protein